MADKKNITIIDIAKLTGFLKQPLEESLAITAMFLLRVKKK